MARKMLTGDRFETLGDEVVHARICLSLARERDAPRDELVTLEVKLEQLERDLRGHIAAARAC